MMQKPVVLAVYVVSGVHAFLGVLNLVVGVIASIRAEVWRAHSVSPIWSGGFVSTRMRKHTHTRARMQARAYTSARKHVHTH